MGQCHCKALYDPALGPPRESVDREGVDIDAGRGTGQAADRTRAAELGVVFAIRGSSAPSTKARHE